MNEKQITIEKLQDALSRIESKENGIYFTPPLCVNSNINLLKPYMDKIELLEMDATVAASHIPDQSLDYIFIDGDHSYSAVVRDLDNYWDKVRTGGIFAGHDWNLPAVNQAVNEFRQKNNITSEIRFTQSNVWFWYK